VVFTGWIFYALGAMSIFVYRRRQPRESGAGRWAPANDRAGVRGGAPTKQAPRPFSVPGYPVTPALFVLAAAALVLNTVFAQPDRALAGIAIVLLGLPAYLFWRNGDGSNYSRDVEVNN
jgi:APA family basic amino acid/polyamine antiporter